MLASLTDLFLAVLIRKFMLENHVVYLYSPALHT